MAKRSASRSLRVVHTIEASQRLVNNDPSPEELALWRSRPTKEHPLVWTHQSGRRSLVLGATASHVFGMDLDEGRALLAELLARATTPTASTGTSGRSGTWCCGTTAASSTVPAGMTPHPLAICTEPH